MSYEAVLKVFSDIAMADSMSYWIVAALTVLIFVVMRAMLPVKSLAILFAPFIFWGGLAGIYTLRQLGIAASIEKAANMVATSAVGMVVALVAMVLVKRALEAATRIRKPVTNVPVPSRERA